MVMIRQGDLLFVSVNFDITKWASRKTTLEDGVLARGEKTGHTHSIKERDGFNAYLDYLNQIILENSNPLTVVHPEHEEITLPPGLWEVRQQRQWSPNGVESRYD